MTRQELLMRHCPWMLVAQQLVGQAETTGPNTAGFIAAMLKGLHAWWGDDETPWCGVFVAHCLKASGMPIAKQWWRARGWLGFGTQFPKDADTRNIPYGALVVLNRPPRASDGHVGFFVKHTHFHDGPGVVLLGGNQNNKVSYASYPLSRVLQVSWPGPDVRADALLRLAGLSRIGALTHDPGTSEA